MALSDKQEHLRPVVGQASEIKLGVPYGGRLAGV